MDKQSFEDKVKDALSQGMKVSKEALSKAGTAVQKFSDKKVYEIEKKHLISKRNTKFQEIGCRLSDLLKVENTSLDNLKTAIKSSDETLTMASEIETLQQEILALDQEIALYEEKIKAVDKDSQN